MGFPIPLAATERWLVFRIVSQAPVSKSSWIIAVGLAAVACWLFSACTPDSSVPDTSIIDGSTMGTSYSVQLPRLPAGLPVEDIKHQIDAMLDRINMSMSSYRQDSELSRFNNNRQSAWFGVSPPLFDVLREAQRISRTTNGALDVTVAPLVDLWGFGPSERRGRPPSQQAIDDRLTAVGYQWLQLRPSPPAVRKTLPGLHVDLSAIAKGYAVDRLAGFFDGLGVQNYLVEIGGEIKARGVNARGRHWRVAVERPADGRRSVHAVVEIKDAGLATSGDYRNYFQQAGRRYSHTIDPRTGRPVVHDLASVTVVAASAMSADAWATALLVLGPEAGYRLAEVEGIAALMIIRSDDGFENRQTGAFRQYLVAE